MSQSNVAYAEKTSATHTQWQTLCSRRDLVANSGVVAWLDGAQVALFYLPETSEGEKLYAIENRDPKSGANVIGRGLIGQIGGELVIASPLYKQHFRLHNGTCVEYPEQQLEVWQVRLNGEQVEIAV
ncbi:nitrite reductase small subunit [Pseudomonas cichorii]|uniref:Nitrite reductase small subunit NirD n=1 Tax=Pseudomonas serbiensis TaxID=3064350 RepID=A0ABT9CIR3_9PSED|nr:MULTISPECIES: nitrite reductase small subunit NirD [Pseudomonas]MDO7925377.1 nitrite reductase small subunit NirD [Pseudomonas sp. KFB-138]GFM85587.1 nitrite reductase small subunit [Pseudomonas cichorii]